MSRWTRVEWDIYCDKCYGNGWAAPTAAFRYALDGCPETEAEAITAARVDGWIVADDGDVCPRCQTGERGPWYDDHQMMLILTDLEWEATS